jgi:hypothetical protein
MTILSVNECSWIRKEDIPKKISDISFNECVRYIYLVRLKGQAYPQYSHETGSYKFGYTNNILNRMTLLRFQKGVSVELISYGYSKNHIKSERYLLDIFNKFRVSNECFRFHNKHDITDVITEMGKVCYMVTTFGTPTPECVCLRGYIKDTEPFINENTKKAI